MKVRDGFLIIACSGFLISPVWAQPEGGGGQDRVFPEHRKEFSQGGDHPFQEHGFHKNGEGRPEFDPERHKQMKEKREKFMKELEGLSPEEREAKMQAFREMRKEEIRKRIDEKFDGKWELASEEERHRVCDKLREKCREQEHSGFACDIADERCSSY